MSGFRDIKVWQKGKELAVEIYRLTLVGEFRQDFGFRDQIRKAAVSIPCNIAEGDERRTNKEAVYFLYVSKGSLAELETQLEIAKTLKYGKSEDYAITESLLEEVMKMLNTMILKFKY